MVLAGLTVLVDPWLEGDLTFAEQAWLYTGRKGRLADVALNLKDIEAQADVILLSQVGRAAASSQPAQGLYSVWTCQCCLASLPVQGLGRPLQVCAERRLSINQVESTSFCRDWTTMLTSPLCGSCARTSLLWVLLQRLQ